MAFTGRTKSPLLASLQSKPWAGGWGWGWVGCRPLPAARSAPNENYTFKEVVNNLYAENIGSTASPWRANARPLYDDFITAQDGMECTESS